MRIWKWNQFEMHAGAAEGRLSLGWGVRPEPSVSVGTGKTRAVYEAWLQRTYRTDTGASMQMFLQEVFRQEMRR